jgi:hypothetical protein
MSLSSPPRHAAGTRGDSRSSPSAPANTRSEREDRKCLGRGRGVPGDFTLFEASVFRYCRCHPGGFSLLLHWHLPPSPAGWAGQPGNGVAVWGRPLSAARPPLLRDSSKRSGKVASPQQRGTATARPQVPSAWDTGSSLPVDAAATSHQEEIRRTARHLH